MKPEKSATKSFANNPLARAILREGLKIQDRFSPEPIYARTGKGYLKSVGVTEIAEAKQKATVREP